MIDNLIRAATCYVSCGSESGTGYLVTDCNVLTARHCVIPAINSGDTITLTFPGPEGDIHLSATIIDQSEKMDICILSVSAQLGRSPIPLNAAMPREGEDWRSFGYPKGKTLIGHRIAGTISHLLDSPKLKMDIDLTVDPSTALQSYSGLSGAAVVSENSSVGLIRLKVDGTLGAISIQQLGTFLADNGIQIPPLGADEATAVDPRGSLADRSAFQETFEQMIASNPGDYVFLKGAHGIGKTTFCSEFEPENHALLTLGTYSLVSQGRGPGAIYRAQPEVFFDWLSTTVSILITGKPSRKEERSYSTLIRETSALLGVFSTYCASTQQHGILFLDGLNEVDHVAMAKLVGLLPQSLPQTMTIVLTAPNYDGVTVSLAGRMNDKNVISLPPLSDEASSAFCWQALVEHKASPALVARMCEKAQGHPLYLRYLIEYANASPKEDDLDDFPVLTGSIEQYYESLWPRLLKDADAIYLLAIMARLRWGIETIDLLKVVTSEERRAFIPTISRIRHLLLTPNTTAIYHSSFAEFLISKTADLETAIQERLAEFCVKESGLEYCVLNVVFHLLRSDDTGRTRAIVMCDQNWVDTCVTLGVEPDTLLFDIEATLAAAVSLGPAVEVMRLLLLSQRVNFRYNVLFAQSARLIAEALIALKRPKEALKHAIRFNTLIVDPNEALQIVFCLIKNDYPKEAIELLELLHGRIIDIHASSFDSFELDNFVNLYRLHIRTLLFMHLADGQSRMRQIERITMHFSRMLKTGLAEPTSDLLKDCHLRFTCLPASYYLCFHDKYKPLAEILEIRPELEAPAEFLIVLLWTLVECVESLERYNLPNKIGSFPQLFSDIERLTATGTSIDEKYLAAILDALIQLGAPSSVVQVLAGNDQRSPAQAIAIKDDNGVDLDFSAIYRGIAEWLTAAFLRNDIDCPLVGAFNEKGWLSSLEQLIRALSWCEGRARRAKADGNSVLLMESLKHLQQTVLQPLAFTLAQRVKWQDSYAIPENAFPLIYERVVLVLMDCYPEELPAFLRGLSDRANDQCGLYSEGFREVMFAVLKKLTKSEIAPSLFDEAFGLLQHWKEHVVRGVENRHELVPELLKLMPIFVAVGAIEEASSLYRSMLGVSMGPSWYKEDQLGLMVSTLRKMPLSDNVQAELPLVAGYLERAAGEMTFQRFVRYEKMALIGELFRRNNIASGCQYFKRQTCGTTTELLLETQQGTIDKPSPMVGMRYPGGALDEQHAILEMVRNAEGIDWRLCWALLEIFQCGDERHFDDFAIEYARLINRAGDNVTAISEMVSRVEFVVGAEIDPTQRIRFINSFRKELNNEHHHAFSLIMAQAATTDIQNEVNVQFEDLVGSASTYQDNHSEIEDKLYLPGTFGKQSSIKQADEALADAGKQLKLRNLDAAKTQAVRVLQILQDGGWSIWHDCLGDTHRAAEELLRIYAANPVDLIRAYAPLIAAERYDSKWNIAEHLIAKATDLLDEEERSQLFKCVIDHVHLMVGDATNEIEMFYFLSEKPERDASVDLFKLVIWLLDHPKLLRRDKAAGMIAWLVERSSSAYLEPAVKEAFSMATGFSADILCGVLDSMSTQQPLPLWDQIFALLDMDDILRNCQHVSRLAVLHRIAERAGKAGSSTGVEVASRLAGQFRSGKIELGDSDMDVDLPNWARCVKSEWARLDHLGLATQEVVNRLDDKMSEICAPLNIQENWNIENAVSTTFREIPNHRFNRWEAKVRFALNTALFPYASQRDFIKIESALRVFNPSLPEHTLTPGFASSADAILKAIASWKDYAGATGNDDYCFLAYHEMTELGKDGNMVHIEVLAMVVPSLSLRGNFSLPSFKKYFRSNELPDFGAGTTYHETCWHLKPGSAFFGSYTPAFPLPVFKELIKAQNSDFSRVSWRNGRSNDTGHFGRPIQEGCLLAVKRAAVQLPEGKKLAWMIRINGEIVTVVDSKNNKLI
ncbi:trypsin-like peptidase domain-containing protein [Candidatus Methylospira mobilis]|uniref:Trypsin-like peptidase domain-containing protein n=1 Tax=Candidatus Methylospira mobilis TaxID=1808979 RepID=A0A5Q0BK69_9GAMM|nr:AVAST type 1 anti-phage system protease Avs1b [Candidatus Methylospira mobilis]QFY42557.1 trypsin-like peptidase domain-containing protein [Candidatus Methylospira mobilis]WNV04326.1 AVAST type 1 anti-phage system protease Avs1b [Candidatus Methylospira mobilis]